MQFCAKLGKMIEGASFGVIKFNFSRGFLLSFF